MINAVTPVNSNVSLSYASPLAAYKQAQGLAAVVSQTVFQSFTLLTGSKDSSLTKEGLNNLKTLLENENLTGGSAYKLVNTVINNFDSLSSGGEKITQSDFMDAVKFSVAQNFAQSSILSGLVPQGSLTVSDEIAEKFGAQNMQTLALINFIDSLPDDTVNKLSSNLSKADNAESKVKSDSDYAQDKTQDYTTVTSAQLKSPFSIAI